MSTGGRKYSRTNL